MKVDGVKYSGMYSLSARCVMELHRWMWVWCDESLEGQKEKVMVEPAKWGRKSNTYKVGNSPQKVYRIISNGINSKYPEYLYISNI